MKLRHRSKIIATIGPACDSPNILEAMFKIGLDVARLNTSHGTLEEHENRIKLIRELQPEAGILIDLPGVKIRTGKLEQNIQVNPGDEICLYASSDSPPADNADSYKHPIYKLPIDYSRIALDLKPNTNVFINDGIIQLEVKSISQNKYVFCSVVSGGVISSRKGLNFADVHTGVPTAEDIERIILGCEMDVDYIGISFVSEAREINRIREIISEHTQRKISIISKIETPKALLNFQDLLKISDGIMVARGDLGVEIPPERVPVEQRRIVYECNRNIGKPVIVATQMLETMTTNPIPTRAEVSDVYTDVQMGADAVMLSGETANGAYPVKTLEMMERIVTMAHSQMPSRDPQDYDSGQGGYIRIQELLGHAVKTMSRQARNAGQPIKAIIIPTRYGSTAKMISKYRPKTPMIAASPNIQVVRELHLVWGLHTIYIQPKNQEKVDDLYVGGLRSGLFRYTIDECLKQEIFTSDDTILVVSSSALTPQSPTNLIGLFDVKDLIN